MSSFLGERPEPFNPVTFFVFASKNKQNPSLIAVTGQIVCFLTEHMRGTDNAIPSKSTGTGLSHVQRGGDCNGSIGC